MSIERSQEIEKILSSFSLTLIESSSRDMAIPLSY